MNHPLYLPAGNVPTQPACVPDTFDGAVTLDDNKLTIHTAASPDMLGFFHHLPGSRFNRRLRKWTCQATPLSAWMLRDKGLECSPPTLALADAWDAAILPPERGSVDVSMMKTTPWKHQIAAAEFCVNKRGSLLALAMGAGKTLVSITLLTHWRCRTVLTLCPKSVLGVWRREMGKHCGLSHQVIVLDEGTNATKDKQFARGMMQSGNYAVTMVVCNYETFWREPLFKRMKSTPWDLLIADESHRCKSATSRQGKGASALADSAERNLLLTGTPMPSGSCLDIFGQYKIIEPAMFGTNYSRFRSKYAICHDQYKNKVLQYVNQDEFISKYKQLAFRVETKDVVDLPEITYTTIPVTLGKATLDAYNTLKKQCLLELESGTVTASNAGVKLIRLAQMASGHVADEEGRIIRIGEEKKQTLVDLLADLGRDEPVVVFCRFKEDLKQIAEVAELVGRRYGEVSGARKDLTKLATMPGWVNVMGVQERAGGVGIDLTRARYVVDFSRGYSLGDYEQKIARVYRPGQDKPTFVYSLVSSGTVDTSVMSALQNKSDVVTEVLKHIKWKGE